MKLASKVLLLVFCCLSFFSSAEEIDLNGELLMYDDVSGELSIDSVLYAVNPPKFHKSTKSTPTKGVSHGSLWVKWVPKWEQYGGRRILRVIHSGYYQILGYGIKDDSIVSIDTSGFTYFKRHNLSHKGYDFKCDTNIDTYFFKADAAFINSFPGYLFNEQEIESYDRNSNFLSGIYFGFIGLAICISIILLVLYKRSLFVYFLFQIIGATLIVALLRFDMDLLYPITFFDDLSGLLPICYYSLGIGIAVYTYKYLRIKEVSSVLSIVLKVYLLAYILISLSVFYDFKFYGRVQLTALPLTFLLCLYFSLVSIRRGNSTGWFIFASCALWFIGAIVTILASVSILPYTHLGRNLPSFTQVADFLILTMGNIYLFSRKNKEAQKSLELSEIRWQNILQNAIDVVIIIGNEGTIRFVNKPIGGKGKDAIIGTYAHSLCETQKDEDNFLGYLKRVLDHGESLSYETMNSSIDMKKKWYSINMSPIYLEDKVDGVTMVLRDITGKREALKEIQLNKERFELLSDMAVEGILIQENFKIIDCNKRAAEIFGYEIEEFRGKTAKEIFPTDSIATLIKASTSVYNTPIEVRGYKKDGSLVDIETIGKPFKVLGDNVRVAILWDASEKKRQESKIMNAIVKGQEDERKRISAELHDGLGQQLTSASLFLNLLEKEVEEFSAKNQEHYKKAIELLRNAIEETRSISQNLMPKGIQEFGAFVALEHMLNSLNNATTVQFQFISNVNSNLRLLESVELALFRIVQEAVNNILKHAKASRATVQIMQHENSLIIQVEDDGRGIEVETGVKPYILQSINSRVKSLNGNLTVDSNNQGTSILVEVPLND